MTASGIASAPENPPANPLENMRVIGWGVRYDVSRILTPLFHGQSSRRKRRVVEWDERDDWVALCVRMGLNAGEIRNLSFSWPQPITTTQQVYDKIDQLHLSRLYKRKDRKRVGTHNQNIIYVFSKLTGQALEYRLEVRDVMRDATPYPGVRFRPDLSLRIDRFQFYVEVQLSKIEGTRWGEKFRNYLKLYKISRKPFRVLFLVDKGTDISTLRRRARDVLQDHPKLDLFLFLTIHEFQHQTDILRLPVWLRKQGNQRVSLL